MSKHYKPVASAIRSDSLLTVIALAGAIILTGCNESAAPEQQDSDTFSLTVVYDEGISGSHSQGTYHYSRNSRVKYAFKPDAGYENISVLIDSGADLDEDFQIAPDSGAIVLNSDVTILAGADRISDNAAERPVHSVAAERQIRSILEPVNSSSILSRYKELGDSLETWRTDSVLMLEIDRIINDIISDSTQWERLDKISRELGGAHIIVTPETEDSSTDDESYREETPILSIPSPDIRTSTLLSGPPIRGSSNRGKEPYAIVHINGVLTDPLSALKSTAELSNTLDAMSLSRRMRYRVSLLYNPSSLYDPENNSLRYVRCLNAASSQNRLLNSLALAVRVAKCSGKKVREVARRYDDLRQATDQILKLSLGINQPEPFAVDLADSIQQWRRADQHVLLVPHSQGNLMSQEAINELRRRDELNPALDSNCLIAISTASPLSSNWGLHETRLKGVVTKGDIILSVGGNSFPQINTSHFSKELSRVKRLRNTDEGMYYIRMLVLRLYMHGFTEGYLRHPEVQTAIQTALTQTQSRCSLGRITLVPFIHVERPESRLPGLWPLTVHLLDESGHYLLGKRRLELYVRDPRVLRVYRTTSGDFMYSSLRADSTTVRISSRDIFGEMLYWFMLPPGTVVN